MSLPTKTAKLLAQRHEDGPRQREGGSRGEEQESNTSQPNTETLTPRVTDMLRKDTSGSVEAVKGEPHQVAR